jgi:Protein of unknown function (DUF2878)
MNWGVARNFVLFQFVWLVAAIGAAQGLSWPGIVAGILVVGHHVASTKDRATIQVIAFTGALGFLAESALVATGMLRYSASWPTDALAPAWIVALWLAFATTLNATRKAIGSMSRGILILLGAALGPLSYLTGERIGALALADPRWISLGATAVVWGAGIPILIAMSERLEQLARDPASSTRT